MQPWRSCSRSTHGNACKDSRDKTHFIPAWTTVLEQVRELRLFSESTSQNECWKHVPLSTLLLWPIACSSDWLGLKRPKLGLPCSTWGFCFWWEMAAFIVSEPQWAGNEANQKQDCEFSLCHPTRRAEGDNMGKNTEQKETPSSHCFNFWWYSCF